jgi:glutathione S-transferase
MNNDRYKVYGDRRSGNCYKVALILSLTGRKFDWVETDVIKAETRSPAFLAQNPNGKVPLLEFPDGRLLAESNAILLHLAEGSTYLPEDAWRRALVYQWLFFEQYSHEPYIAVARFLLHYDHGLEVSDDRLVMLKERGEQALDVMNGALSTQDYFAGSDFTIADIALYAYTHVAADGGFDTGAWPAVSQWLARVAERPGLFKLEEMTF